MTLSRLSVAVTCWALMGAAPSFAQGRTGGLFGATRSDAGARDKLNVEVFLSEALTSEVPSEFRSIVPEDSLLLGRRSTLFAASADYARNRRRVQVFSTASTYLRYATDLDRMAAVSHHATLGAGIRLSNRGSLKITQTAAYAPPYLYELFPTAAPATFGDVMPANAAYRTESSSYHTAVALALGSPRGTQVTATTEYGVTDFKHRPNAPPALTTYAARAGVAHSLSRQGRVSVQYQYRTGEFALGGLTKTHRVTMGVAYSPALSATRRVTFRLDVSPSVIERPLVPGFVEGRQSQLQGEAGVQYPFRLNWRAEASYRRSVEYVPGLNEPVFSNGARIHLTGVVGRRVDVVASAGHARAASAVSRTDRNLGTYTGEARLRYALTRASALYSEYLYSSYDLGQQARFAPGLPTVYEQHEIRVGFTVFVRALGR